MVRFLILLLVSCSSSVPSHAPQETPPTVPAPSAGAPAAPAPATLLEARGTPPSAPVEPELGQASQTKQPRVQQGQQQEGQVDFCGKSWSLESIQLYCGDDAVTDLRPLASLTKLEMVSLTVQARDLSPLASLRNLHELELFTCGRVRDISPLAKLENLRVLSLERTSVRDIAALTGLRQLESLNLAHTTVHDLRPLSKLPRLHTLYLGHNFMLRDLTPLSSIKALRKLDIEEARSATKDLSALKSMGKLEDLGLRHSQLTSLEPLSGLSSLRSLDLSVSRVGDLAPLAKLAGSLEELSLGGASVEGLEHLARLKRLTFLDLSFIPITDVTPLLGLKRLKNLRLIDTNLSEVQFSALKKGLPKAAFAR